MGKSLKYRVWILGVAFLLSGAMLAAPPSRQVMALSNFFLYVKDETGAYRPDASVVIRYRFGEHQWERFTSGRTGADGCVILQLDPAEDYVVLVYYNEFGLQEHWAYGYIGKQDWARSEKTFQRNRPWIDQVDMGTGPCVVGNPRDVTVTIAHGYRDTDYDFEVKVAMIIDDDGQPPYLSEMVSEPQVFYNGIEPFHFAYTPVSEGQFLVRFIIYTRFEANAWEISDDGGWQWQIEAIRQVDAPAVIRGQVYEDMNHNGAYTPAEPLIAGVRMLLAQGDVIVAETETGDDGQYKFSVLAGSYQVSIGHPPYGFQVPEERAIACRSGPSAAGHGLGSGKVVCLCAAVPGPVQAVTRSRTWRLD